MTIRYHVTVDRQGEEWWAVCPALRHHGAAIGGETREEALVHIENAILMILKEMASNGVPPPPDQMAPYGVALTIETEVVQERPTECRRCPPAHPGNPG